jgi:hypothetical protein
LILLSFFSLCCLSVTFCLIGWSSFTRSKDIAYIEMKLAANGTIDAGVEKKEVQ